MREVRSNVAASVAGSAEVPAADLEGGAVMVASKSFVRRLESVCSNQSHGCDHEMLEKVS